MIRLHNIVYHTKVLGPGVRTAVWLQGCLRKCEGCMSASSRPLNGGREIPVAQLFECIKEIKDIEGITISGGEPFLQPGPLHAFLTLIRGNTDLGVIIYTGYTLKQLRKMKNADVEGILSDCTDLLIDGEYIDSLNDGASLKGSSNQELHFLTDRYKPYASMYASHKRDIEIFSSKDSLLLVGVPPKETLDNWEKVVAALNDPSK